jgi:hypothetical protein
MGAHSLASLCRCSLSVSPVAYGSEGIRQHLDMKSGLTKLLGGNTDFSFPAGKTITVAVEKVSCRAGNMDITSQSCDLTFGGQVVNLKGRSAHELFATLAEIGVQPDGAAGSVYEAVSNLRCTIDSNEVKQKSGGRAECQYAPAN